MCIDINDVITLYGTANPTNTYTHTYSKAILEDNKNLYNILMGKLFRFKNDMNLLE